MAFEELPFINSSFREFPLDVQLALADYKLYGEKSYAFQNKAILNRIYLTNNIIKYEENIIVDAFDYQLKNNVKLIFGMFDINNIKTGNINEYIDDPHISLCLFRSSEIEKFESMYTDQILEKLFLSTAFLTNFIRLVNAKNCNSMFNRVVKNRSIFGKLIMLTRSEGFRNSVKYSLINNPVVTTTRRGGSSYTKSNARSIDSLFKDSDFLFCISSIWAFSDMYIEVSNKFGTYTAFNGHIGDGYSNVTDANIQENNGLFIYKDIMTSGITFYNENRTSDYGLISIAFWRK